MALAVVVASCSDKGLLSPPTNVGPQMATFAALAMPSVRISEIHYDNASTDAGEAIEISGPAGTNVAGWKLFLYNGANNLVYDSSRVFTGTIPATCGARGVLFQTYSVDGIQNGSPDGIALVNAARGVVEFLSYEGTMTAANGPAAGMTSTDIGVAESGTTPVGHSVKRNGDGAWSLPSAHSFGTCNDQDETPPAVVASVVVSPNAATIEEDATQQFTAVARDASDQPIAGVTFTWSSDTPAIATVNGAGLATGVAPGDAYIIATAPNGVADSAQLHVDAAPPPPPPPGLPATRFSEIHYDNFGTDANEAIEIEGPAGTDLTGWSVVLYNGNGGVPYDTRALSGTIALRCDGRGVVALRYAVDGIQNGSPDGFALIDGAGNVVEFLSYEGVVAATDGPAAGTTSTDIGAAEVSSPAGQSLQRDANGVWTLADANIGGCNNGVGGPPPPPPGSIAFAGRVPADPPLPVGFQDQIFATVRNSSGQTVTTTITWTSETPGIASIDADGVITALAAGTAILRATAEDGTTATYSLPMAVAMSSTTAQYQGNTEFGDPTDADASDDFIVRRAQYTTSYNRLRGIPNWVSFDLEATHFGSEDRCDCFTTDPLLPTSFASYTTAAYTGAGAFHGYGIDRGHLARSFDRTSASLDNATTYYFSNIIPQAADVNQGPWAIMETYLGDKARLENKEVYVITGPAGSKGTIKNQGVITIPSHVWKVAVIMPRDQGLANIDDFSDLSNIEVVAVIMPNEAGLRNVNWETYKTTVDAVEALSGYDLLKLLRDDIEIAVESGTRPPVAAVNGPFTSSEGSAVAMSATGSTDPDGDALTFAWTFGDGGVATGATVSHTYAQNGTYNVRVIATDSRDLADTVFTTATVSNVAPVFAPASGATIYPGDTWTGSGSFTDPGSDSFTATVNYGDGSGVAPLPLSGKTFALSHRYAVQGTYTVTVTVNDGTATSTQTRIINVMSLDQAIPIMIAQLDELVAAGRLPEAYANNLTKRFETALAQLDRRPDQMLPLLMQLTAAGKELDAMVRAGHVSETDAAIVRKMIARVLYMIPLADRD